MLATFVIGLREGLEAALIVGIVAAFLKTNGRSLKAMWLGVAAAIAASLAVGLGLAAAEAALPQAAQEGLETLIGAVAVVFVTGMIFWMNAHARDLKNQLEAEAAAAIGRSSALALAVMAFLAVLKEGFETSVFLLATFSAAQSAGLAAAGALAGLLVSAVIGYGIYVGGVRINLSRFFRVTGAFLILVAAGLVVASLRTAHEAGWLNAGQVVAANLSLLVEPGTVQSALVTGVLGIPADPRVVEVLGWIAYIVPVSLMVYWPQHRRPDALGAARLKIAVAGGLAFAALALALLLPRPLAGLPASADLVAGSGPDARTIGSLSLTNGPDGAPVALEVSQDGRRPAAYALADATARHDQHEGLSSTAYELPLPRDAAGAPATLTLQQVADLGGGRLPRGLNPAQHPGPFKADWTLDRTLMVWTASDRLLDARLENRAIVSLTSDDLATPRTLRVADVGALPFANAWRIGDAYRDEALATLAHAGIEKVDHAFWAREFPLALLALALLLGLAGVRALRSRDAAGTRNAYSREGTLHAAE